MLAGQVVHQSPNRYRESKCPYIAFGESAKEAISSNEIELALAQQNNRLAIIATVGYSIVGSSVIALSVWLGKTILDKGVIAMAPFIIGIIGISVIGMGLSLLMDSHRKLKVAKDKCSNMQVVFSLYGLTYQASVSLHDGGYGLRDAQCAVALIPAETEQG